MFQVTIHEAKTHLSRLLRTVRDGEEIVIAKGKTPIAKLSPLPASDIKRRIGGAKGIVEKMSSDFNEPLTEFSEYMK